MPDSSLIEAGWRRPGAAGHPGWVVVPLVLTIVRGVHGSRSHRRRQPTYLLVNARQDRDGVWVLPYAVAELLGWAWQRWEVEVLHRDLKSGFGLGRQQAWTATGAVTQWVVWVYAVVLLAAYRAWGYACLRAAAGELVRAATLVAGVAVAAGAHGALGIDRDAAGLCAIP